MINKTLNRRRVKDAARNKKITAKQFLGRVDDFKGYTNGDEFTAYLDSLRDPEFDDLAEFFGCVAQGLKLSNVSRVRRDRAQREYIYPVPIQPKSGSGLKVILEAGMLRFVEDYVKGEVEIDFSFDELSTEAYNVE